MTLRLCSDRRYVADLEERKNSPIRRRNGTRQLHQLTRRVMNCSPMKRLLCANFRVVEVYAVRAGRGLREMFKENRFSTSQFETGLVSNRIFGC